jgi:hypothetical protein
VRQPFFTSWGRRKEIMAVPEKTPPAAVVARDSRRA